MTDANEFEGEVVLVTAAAGLGIGQATARRLAAGGANIVVTDIHPGRTEKVAQSMREDFPDSLVVGIPLDAGDRDQIDAAVEKVVGEFGRIDILVNNAAVNIIKPVFDCDPDDWDRVMAVNINGPWYLARRVLPIMRERRHGVIINVTSYAGDVGGAGIETPYAVSKGALNTLTRCLAHEAGPYGIRVNSVSPGLTDGNEVPERPSRNSRTCGCDGAAGLDSTQGRDRGIDRVPGVATRGAHHRRDPQHLRRCVYAQLTLSVSRPAEATRQRAPTA